MKIIHYIRWYWGELLIKIHELKNKNDTIIHNEGFDTDKNWVNDGDGWKKLKDGCEYSYTTTSHSLAHHSAG